MYLQLLDTGILSFNLRCVFLLLFVPTGKVILILYVESLEALAPWFFALDHTNYARWIPIHIRDMKSLPASIKQQFKDCWVVQKTKNKFSSIPIDQAHEQNNAVLKGSGGMIGLTENPSAFRKWMIAGPEQARLIVEFDSQFLNPSSDSDCLQHEQTLSI